MIGMVSAGFIAAIAIAVETSGAIDWHKVTLRPILLSFLVVFVTMFIYHYVKAQLQLHKECVQAIVVSCNTVQAHHISEQLSFVISSLSLLNPNEHPFQDIGKKIHAWNDDDLHRYRFQQQYQMVRSLAASSNLDITSGPTNAACSLPDSGSHFKYVEVLESINKYNEAVQAYAAREQEKLARLSTS
jgi:hypothetical protein